MKNSVKSAIKAGINGATSLFLCTGFLPRTLGIHTVSRPQIQPSIRVADHVFFLETFMVTKSCFIVVKVVNLLLKTKGSNYEENNFGHCD